jgi:hypothetical protein
MYFTLLFRLSLTNNYQPRIFSTSVSTTTNSIIITADVGVANSYLIVAYINQTFDMNTMALPTTYLMKMGNFSSSWQFNRVYMVYGRSKITITMANLS